MELTRFWLAKVEFQWPNTRSRSKSGRKHPFFVRPHNSTNFLLTNFEPCNNKLSRQKSLVRLLDYKRNLSRLISQNNHDLVTMPWSIPWRLLFWFNATFVGSSRFLHCRLCEFHLSTAISVMTRLRMRTQNYRAWRVFPWVFLKQ